MSATRLSTARFALLLSALLWLGLRPATTAGLVASGFCGQTSVGNALRGVPFGRNATESVPYRQLGPLVHRFAQDAAKKAAQPGPQVISLPRDAIARLGTTDFRHGSRILCLAFSPDGKQLVAGGGYDPVRVWDVGTGKEVRQLKDFWIHAAVFSPNGRLLATAGGFKLVRVWEAATGREIMQLKGHSGAVRALAFANDGITLASAGQDRTIRLWDMIIRGEVARLEGHTNEINALAFASDGKTLASAGADWNIRVWDATAAKPLRTFSGGCNVACLAFTPDGKTLATAGDDHVIRLWDPATGKELRKIAGHEGPIASLTFAPDGKTLITGAQDRTIRLWDIENGAERRKIARHGGDSDALALSADGTLLASGGLNHTIHFWSAATGEEVRPARGFQGGVTSLTFSPDGKHLLVGTSAQTLHYWDWKVGKELWGQPGQQHGETLVAASPDGSLVAVASGTEPVRLVTPATGQNVRVLDRIAGDPVLSLAFAPDGKTLAVGYRSSGVILWDVGTGQDRGRLKYPGSVHTLAFSLNGETLAVAGSNRITLYLVATSKELRTFGDTQPVAALAFSPGSDTLAAGMYNSMIRLWDMNDGTEPTVLEGHAGAVLAIAFSPDGRYLISGSFDRTARLWEVASGHQVAEWTAHGGEVSAAAFSRDGKIAATGSGDTTVLVWDATRSSRDGQLPPVKFAPGELKGFWDELASENAPRAHQVVWMLIAGGQDSVPFLATQVFLVDPKHIAQLVEDLSSPKYPIRTKAEAELGRYGRWVEGVLRAALKKPVDEENRRRIERLLTKLEAPGGLTFAQERVRLRRIMAVLEQVNSPAARELLQRLAAGAAEESLRQEARRTLERLQKAG